MNRSSLTATAPLVRMLIAAALPAAAALILFSGCQTAVPRFRTLPRNYQTIYIPMVENQTFEPAIEETATRLIQEEFMADGRLRVTRREDADIVVQCRLKRFDRRVASREGDDFPQSDQVSIVADILVFERGAAEPFGVFSNVGATQVFLSNTRQSLVRVEPDWKHQLLSNLAREVVVQVITGDYSGQSLPQQQPVDFFSPAFRDDQGRELDYRL